MATAAQTRANQQNAQHSTGPRTGEGKQRSSQNALKHGLRAKEPLIPGEDPDEFDRHSAEHIFQLHPDGILEENLVDQLIDLSWRLKRCGRLEAAMLNELHDTTTEQSESEDRDTDQIFGKSLLNSNGLTQLNRMGRYEAQLSRQYHRVMKEFRELRRTKIRSRILNGFSTEHTTAKPAQPSKPADRTQSILSLLELTAKMDPLPEPAPREGGPTRLTDPDIHLKHPKQPSQPGNKEAAA